MKLISMYYSVGLYNLSLHFYLVCVLCCYCCLQIYSKICLKRATQNIDKTKVLKTDYCLMQAKSIAECPSLGNQFLVFFLNARLRQV